MMQHEGRNKRYPSIYRTYQLHASPLFSTLCYIPTFGNACWSAGSIRHLKDNLGLDYRGGQHLSCLIISESILADVEDMVSAAASFESISEKDVVTGFDWGFAEMKEDFDEDCIWFRSDFERLIAMGVPVDRKKVILWDGLLG